MDQVTLAGGVSVSAGAGGSPLGNSAHDRAHAHDTRQGTASASTSASVPGSPSGLVLLPPGRQPNIVDHLVESFFVQPQHVQLDTDVKELDAIRKRMKDIKAKMRAFADGKPVQMDDDDDDEDSDADQEEDDDGDGNGDGDGDGDEDEGADGEEEDSTSGSGSYLGSGADVANTNASASASAAISAVISTAAPGIAGNTSLGVGTKRARGTNAGNASGVGESGIGVSIAREQGAGSLAASALDSNANATSVRFLNEGEAGVSDDPEPESKRRKMAKSVPAVVAGAGAT